MNAEQKRRTLAQNKYRFSVIVRGYRDWLNLFITNHNKEKGTNLPLLTDKDANFYLKDKVWKKVERVEMPFGTLTIELPIKGSDTKRFEEYMEEARAFAATELGLELGLPNEDIRDLEEQYTDNLSRL